MVTGAREAFDALEAEEICDTWDVLDITECSE